MLGNIATYNQNGTTYTYTYDAQNQLTKQTGGGKTYTYSYDTAGNILTASDGTTSHTYTYGNATWRDLLTAYDGQSISYDGAGNPTSYYNGTRWTMGWQEGRRLVSASNGTASLTFTYDSDGLRLKKDAGAIDSEYFYAGGKLVRMHVRNNTVGLWQIFDFFYDHNGHPYAVKHKIDNAYTTYYYITNLQGDVLGLTTADGTAVVNYTYDPYGKVLSTTGSKADILGLYNPLRYRGYVYDQESGLYYLQSRYYDPTIGRFINADSFASTGQGILGNNMFAYCLNNPANMKDNLGSDAIYVVDTSQEQGIPVVGHAILYIQDDDGNWYMTDYAGVFPDKSTAHIRFRSASVSEIQNLKEHQTNSSLSSVYISGDFSTSVEVARQHYNTDYGGYNFAFNNCMHYTQQMLLHGTFDSYFDYIAVSGNYNPTPIKLYRTLSEAKVINAAWKGVVDSAKVAWEFIQNLFST